MKDYLLVESTQTSSLNQLCYIINDWAEKKGWNEDETKMSHREVIMHKAEQLALMHSELSECLEFIRTKNELPDGTHIPVMDDHVPALTGEAAELADVLIRIFHYCGKRNINLGEAVRLKHEYNTSRPYKHGKNS